MTVTKYIYVFGIDKIDVGLIDFNNDCYFMSETIETGKFNEGDYLQLQVNDNYGEFSSIEYFIVDGDIEIPILPINEQYVYNEKIFPENDLRFAIDDDLYAKGEKPEALLDWPVDATDYELVDIFNWQEEAAGMISQMEFVRRVDVQTETIERYVREGKLIPDLVVPMSEHRTFKYFKDETLKKYAQQFGWTLIDDSNRKDMFMDMIRQMDMSYSYKPVLIKAILLYADPKGMVKLSDIVAYFRSFYEERRAASLPVEKRNSIFAKGNYTDKDAERNILANPFKRFEDMQMLRHTKTLGIVQVEETVWKHLNAEEKTEIDQICDHKLQYYYERLKQ
jgi:hypothetical protein